MDNQDPKSLIEYIDALEKEGIPKSDYLKNIGGFLERKSRRLRIPVHGNFELTPLCNFDCKMCYIHLDHTQFNEQNLLPVNVWEQLADSARNAGMRLVSLTGGECLTYPGFDELYTYLVSSGLGVYVMSNGYLIDEEKIELFKKHRPHKIQISIYGSSEDAYEAVTGVRAFSKVYENIISIRDAGLPLSLSITPSAYMRDDVESLIHMAEEMQIKYGVNPLLMNPRENTGRTKDDLSVDEYMDIYRLLSSIHHEERQTVEWDQIPETNHAGMQRYGIRCGAGRSSFGIKYDGNMSPCLSLYKITAKPLEIGFEEAWRSINKASDEFALPLECGDCVYQKKCLTCVAIHEGVPEPGHCDPLVCARMKKLVQEGFIPLKNIC